MSGPDIVALLNQHRGAFDHALGLVFTEASLERIACEVPVAASLKQPYGLVHGGVYASIVETLGSAGAAINAMAKGGSSVGLENSTTFLRAVREGTLHGVATPIHRGGRSQVWAVDIRDDAGKLVASGRLRTMTLEAGAKIAGEKLGIK